MGSISLYIYSKRYDVRVSKVSPEPTGDPLFETFVIGDWWGYSPRRLSASAVNAFEIQHVSNTGQSMDVPFVGHEANSGVDLQSIIDFANNGDGTAYISTWYDQGPNANHATAWLNNTGQTMRIVEGGVFVSENGFMGGKTNGNNIARFSITTPVLVSACIYAGYERNYSGNTLALGVAGRSTGFGFQCQNRSTNPIQAWNPNDGTSGQGFMQQVNQDPDFDLTGNKIRYWDKNNLYKNGVDLPLKTQSVTGKGQCIVLWAAGSSSRIFLGTANEVILFDEDQFAESLNDNLNSYYSFY